MVPSFRFRNTPSLKRKVQSAFFTFLRLPLAYTKSIGARRRTKYDLRLSRLRALPLVRVFLVFALLFGGLLSRFLSWLLTFGLLRLLSLLLAIRISLSLLAWLFPLFLVSFVFGILTRHYGASF